MGKLTRLNKHILLCQGETIVLCSLENSLTRIAEQQQRRSAATWPGIIHRAEQPDQICCLNTAFAHLDEQGPTTELHIDPTVDNICHDNACTSSYPSDILRSTGLFISDIFAHCIAMELEDFSTYMLRVWPPFITTLADSRQYHRNLHRAAQVFSTPLSQHVRTAQAYEDFRCGREWNDAMVPMLTIVFVSISKK